MILEGGHRTHLVECGEGPLVVLVHGFPETSASWRNQIPAIAEAGFRRRHRRPRLRPLVKPVEVERYALRELAADLVGTIEALGERRAIVIGHDWGSAIATTAALLEPEAISAVALLGVPYQPPGGPRPTSIFDAIGGDDEFYVAYFQAPGRAEEEVEPDVRRWLAGFYAALSAETAVPDVYMIPAGGRMLDRFPPPDLRPAWLTDDVPGFVRRRVRTHGPDRRAEPLPQRRPGLGAAGRLDGAAGRTAGALHRRCGGRVGRLARRRDRCLPDDAPRLPRGAPHPGGRALGAPGATRGGQRTPRRLAARGGRCAGVRCSGRARGDCRPGSQPFARLRCSPPGRFRALRPLSSVGRAPPW